MSKGLKLTDILVTIVIAFVFGLIYKVWGSLYGIVAPLGIQLDQLIYGFWFIAAPVAFLVIRKPGVALLAEVAASQVEFLFGSEWGLSALIYGIIQGLMAELVFAAFGYKRYSLSVVSLAAVASTIGSIGVDIYYRYIDNLAFWNLSILVVARVVGAIIIAGFFAFYLVKAIEATGVTGLLRPASKADYDALDN